MIASLRACFIRALTSLGPGPTLLWVGCAFLAVYAMSNHLTHLRDDVGAAVFEWERSIPFVPWTIVPYLSIAALFALSFYVAGDDRVDRARHAARLLLALAISVACYAAFPLRFAFERPPTPGWLGLLFDALTAFDLPYNRAPSLHISVLLILWVRLAPHTRRWCAGALNAWCAAIAVSVLTTWQHHVIDVPAGLAVGWLCVVALRQRRSVRRRNSTTAAASIRPNSARLQNS